MMSSPSESSDREQWATKTDEHRTDFARAESPVKYQLAAWALWIAGLIVECGGILAATGAIRVPVLSDLPVLTVILVLVMGLVLVLLAQRMWKRAGNLARETSKQGVLGVVMACISYIPMCLFFITAKNATPRTKVVAVVSSLVADAAIAALCWLFLAGPLAQVESVATVSGA